MSVVAQADLDWFRARLAGCAPGEVARIKALVAAACGAPSAEASSLIDIRDDLAGARAILHALDLGLCGIAEPDRNALRTIAEIALDRLDAICAQVDVLRGEGSGVAG